MKIDNIEILTKQLKATKKFYETILNLPIIESDAQSMTVKIGSSILKFVETLDQSDSIYHLAFNIPENKLNEATEWCKNRVDLIKKGDAVLVAEFESWNANAVYFFDNNNNLLEFISRKNLKNSTTEIFSSTQILNISEIGMVSENPLDFGNELVAKYGLSLFEKNQNSEMFTAIGDDEGLLIIVKPNRNWYPTEIPAKTKATKIQLTNNGQSNTIEIHP